MSRWLFALCCALMLLSLGFAQPRRSPDARTLGGTCDADRDCQVGLQCTFAEGVMQGQCAASCNATPACQDRFGEQSMCLAADLCARTCKVDADCERGGECNHYGWCEAR